MEKEKRIEQLKNDGYSQECAEKMVEYFEKFGEYLPGVLRFMPENEEEILNVIDECLKNEKDVYEMGIIDNDVLWD